MIAQHSVHFLTKNCKFMFFQDTKSRPREIIWQNPYAFGNSGKCLDHNDEKKNSNKKVSTDTENFPDLGISIGILGRIPPYMENSPLVNSRSGRRPEFFWVIWLKRPKMGVLGLKKAAGGGKIWGPNRHYGEFPPCYRRIFNKGGNSP